MISSNKNSKFITNKTLNINTYNHNSQLETIKNFNINAHNDYLFKNINNLLITNNTKNLNITIVNTNTNSQKILTYIDELNEIINNQKETIKLKDYENQQLIKDNIIVKSNIDILINRYGLDYIKRV